MSKPTKGRVKRARFTHQTRILERRDPEILDHLPDPIQTHAAALSSKKMNFQAICTEIPRSHKCHIPDKFGEENRHPSAHLLYLRLKRMDYRVHRRVGNRGNPEWRWGCLHQIQRRRGTHPNINHPMHSQMSKPARGRFKRSSFIRQSRMPERRGPELLDHLPEPIQTRAAALSWRKK
ncbi:hypothetical protein BaRGS_00005366, partial [Batillaria attramentaria]